LATYIKSCTKIEKKTTIVCQSNAQYTTTLPGNYQDIVFQKKKLQNGHILTNDVIKAKEYKV